MPSLRTIGVFMAALVMIGCAPPAAPASTPTPEINSILINRDRSAAKSSAAGPDLSIEDFSLVQAVLGEPLVVGKPTAARVQIASASKDTLNATIKVTVDGKAYERTVTITDTQTVVAVQVDPPATVAPVKASVSIAPVGAADANPGDNAKNVTYQTIQTPERVVLFFLPVDWSPEDQAKYNFQATVTQFARDTGNFFAAVYPLPPEQVSADFTTTPHMLSGFEKAITDSKGKDSQRNELALYAGISFAGHRYRPDATFIVGVLPPKWFDNHGKPNVLGFAMSGVVGVTTAQYEASLEPIVAAHEIGHLYGLYDDYDLAVRPARRCIAVPVPGYWVEQGREVARTDVKDLCTIMSTASNLHWADQRIYEYLMAKVTLNRGKVSAPMILAAATAWRLDPEGYPSEMLANIRRFEPGQAVYLSVAGAALPAGSTIEVKLYSGDKLVRSVGKQKTVAGDKWYGFTVADEGQLKAGNYRLDVLLDGQVTKSTDFEVKASQ